MAYDTATHDLSDHAVLAQLKALLQRVIDEQERETLDIDNITAETDLLSLPLDSLATVELMHGIEETFNIYVREDAAFEFQTMGDVIRHIQEQRARSAQ